MYALFFHKDKTQESAASVEEISVCIQVQISTFEEIGASIQAVYSMSKILQEEANKFKVD